MTSGFSRLGLPFAVKRTGVRRRWFTLIEIIIASTIFLLIAVALFSYSSETSRSWSKIVVERNRFKELLTLDRALDTILRHAVPFVWTDRETELNPEVPFIVATGDVLRCAYLHRLNNPDEGAIRFVELSVRDNNLWRPIRIAHSCIGERSLSGNGAAFWPRMSAPSVFAMLIGMLMPAMSGPPVCFGGMSGKQ